ncbi:hypothetical protein DESUT3_16080 [Desulfuromonas versatilis]|uniref:DUF2845 domain-containing protein n=1 Tax=Desulfuromonas versatilis TaxID=2802975 RepID=A0ABM8HVJ0_9BACT|nr:DUF2845 domain-containing protein [Desulfuromonas versatilis]BCR04539.1 hypothetical protein DESUT3_16080 [Desulfuromonas versatilis]
MQKVPWSAVAVVATLCSLSASAWAMRCNGSLVDIGESKPEVLAKCGEPLFQNLVAVETASEPGAQGARSEQVPVEQMVYDQGEGTLLKVLTFKGGRLVAISDGARVSGSSAKPGRFLGSLGDSQAEIYEKYGTPAYKELVRIETTTVFPAGQETGDGALQTTEENVEQWTYDFGPETFLKILTFKAGRLVQVGDGPRQ